MDELYSDALLDRIKLLIVRKHVVSINNWAIKQLGMQQSTVDRILKKQARLNLEFIVKILELYPEVSAEWLLRGKGDMHDAVTEKSVNNEVAMRNMQIDFLRFQKRLKQYAQEINELECVIDEKNKIIDEFIRA